MRRLITAAAFVALSAAAVHSQSAPHSVGELSYRLVSPTYLGGGAHITRTNSPFGIVMNPAAAAGFQRITLAANYSNLQGLTYGASGMGHAANIAVSIPSKIGVFSAGATFMDTLAYAGEAMDMGISGQLHLAFSKEIYSDIWFGMGLMGGVGEVDGVLQGGASVSFGFLHYLENLGGVKNFMWGAALTGIGYNYGSQSRGYLNALPGNLTLAVGVALDVVDVKAFRWTLRSDLRVPSVSDLWLGLASDMYFGEVARFSFSSSVDLRDALDGSWHTAIPSAFISVHFPLGRRRNGIENLRTTEMDLQIASAPLYNGVWAFSAGIILPFGVRDEQAPLVEVDYSELPHISPNYDGVQDELILPHSVSDERYVAAYRWWITDSEGKVTKTYVNKDERPENESVKNLWKRLVSPKTGTALPEVFRWDGVTDGGAIAPDGRFQVFMEFLDDNGNSATAGPFLVEVDNQPPELSMVAPEGLDLVFSPDGDGFKETLSVEQSGSVERHWEGSFRDASGEVISSHTWDSSEPQSFEWDGTDDSGEIVPDGVYRFVQTSTDAAGNRVEDVIEGIIVDTKQPEVGLAIDRPIFSPGTESAVSAITLTPDISLRKGIVDWNVEVLNRFSEPVRTWSSQEAPAPPQSIVFNGLDNKGGRLDEGVYSARLQVEYGNGYRPEVVSPLFTVDITAPTASVSADWSLFSPQSGSQRDKVSFSQRTSREKSWQGSIADSAGNMINTWSWLENAADTLVWDGRDRQGRLAADGTYTYLLESVDQAGNAGTSAPVRVTVDTSAVEASLTSSRDVFGPTGNGVNDNVVLFMAARTDSPVSSWVLTVSDESGTEIRRWSGEGAPQENIAWNGLNETGSPAPDGAYRASLVVEYTKGDAARAFTDAVMLDTTPPRIDMRINDGLFSPDGDDEKDRLSITQSSSEELSFEGTVYNAANLAVKSWTWKDSLDSIQWEGRDDSGNILPDGEYRYEVWGVDAAGNVTRREHRGIRIDTAPTPVYLTAKEGYIKAGESDPARVQSFSAVTPNSQGISSWTFSVVAENGGAVVSQSGDGPVPGQFTWNGTDERNRPVEGLFTGVLTVNYAKGARPRAQTRPFVSDGSPPNLSVRMEPQPFSPDEDNVDDELVIGLTVEDRSRISEWNLEIFDPRNREFINFSGRGRPSERIIWDGRSGKGEIVESAEDYPYRLTVTDVLGQTAVQSGSIAVDVLVIREGNRLKIQINNITFQPSSPRLTLDGEEGEKNRFVLDRLAQIMKKYASYRIVVEGHAVSLNWANPVAAAREQEDVLIPLSRSRAQTVVSELVDRGIAAGRMNAEGIGGEKPIVPHGDLEERWRNRRVEFYLEK